MFKKIRSVLGRQFGWSGVIEGSQLVSSVVLMLLLGRIFGPNKMSPIIVTQALAANVLSIANFGTHILTMQAASRGSDSASIWSKNFWMSTVATVTGYCLLALLWPVLLPAVDANIFHPVMIGNLIFFWMGELGVFFFIGRGDLKSAAMLRLILAAFRIAALVCMVVLTRPSPSSWAWISMTFFAVAALVTVIYVRAKLGILPKWSRLNFGDYRRGVPYAVSAGSESTIDQSDRWMLGSMGHKLDAGLYGQASRIVQFGYMPLRILLRTFDAKLYRSGADGLNAALRVTKQMAPAGLLLGFGASALIWVGAPLVPILLGSEWAAVDTVIRFACFLPALRSGSYLLGNALTASGLQWWRFTATGTTLLINVGLNLWLLPKGSWRTAVGTTFVSEVLLVVLLAFFVWRLSHRNVMGADPVA